MHKLRWIVKYQSCIFLKNSQKGTFLNINHLSKLLIYEIWSFYNPAKSPFWYFFSQMAYFSFSTDQKNCILSYIFPSLQKVVLFLGRYLLRIFRDLGWILMRKNHSFLRRQKMGTDRIRTYMKKLYIHYSLEDLSFWKVLLDLSKLKKLLEIAVFVRSLDSTVTKNCFWQDQRILKLIAVL